jgi:S1-C subfamily serine protease
MQRNLNMRKRTILALIAGACAVTVTVAVAAGDSNRSAPKPGTGQLQLSASPAGRGRLGFGGLEISPELRRFLGAPDDRGVLVNQLRGDSPAARAGLRVGDVVLDVGGTKVDSVADIVEAISDRKQGEVITLQVARGKDRVTLRATLDSDPGPRVQAFGQSNGGGWRQLDPGEGFDPRQLFGDPELRRELDATRQRLEQLEQRLDKLEHR